MKSFVRYKLTKSGKGHREEQERREAEEEIKMVMGLK
jgi:hypothetical protein